MTRSDSTSTSVPTAAEMLAAYEDRVVATSKAWQEYRIVIASYREAQDRANDLWKQAEQAYDAWADAKKRREELYDAYWARYDVAA